MNNPPKKISESFETSGVGINMRHSPDVWIANMTPDEVIEYGKALLLERPHVDEIKAYLENT